MNNPDCADPGQVPSVGEPAGGAAPQHAQAVQAPTDPILCSIVEHLVSLHGAHTILLYGSRADGSATPDSDYDLAAFAPISAQVHEARQVDGAYLDLFVYPEAMMRSPTQELLPLRGSKVVAQRDEQVQAFLRGLDMLFARGPEPLAPDEIEVRRSWAMKMAARCQRGDVEGNYRRVWLLHALLEDYFQIGGMWYQGPKKALNWLKEFDALAFQSFSEALEPGASHESILRLVRVVAQPRDR